MGDPAPPNEAGDGRAQGTSAGPFFLLPRNVHPHATTRPISPLFCPSIPTLFAGHRTGAGRGGFSRCCNGARDYGNVQDLVGFPPRGVAGSRGDGISASAESLHFPCLPALSWRAAASAVSAGLADVDAASKRVPARCLQQFPSLAGGGASDLPFRSLLPPLGAPGVRGAARRPQPPRPCACSSRCERCVCLRDGGEGQVAARAERRRDLALPPRPPAFPPSSPTRPAAPQIEGEREGGYVTVAHNDSRACDDP